MNPWSSKLSESGKSEKDREAAPGRRKGEAGQPNAVSDSQLGAFILKDVIGALTKLGVQG